MLLKIFKSKNQLYSEAQKFLIKSAKQAVKEKGRFFLVLSGGGTPIPLYDLLTTSEASRKISWKNVHLFWGDERCVPPDHEESNYGQAKKHLLDKISIPINQIHRIMGELAPEEAANQYNKEIALLAGEKKKWPSFDLVILGLGTDGHVASVFPRSEMDVSTASFAIEGDYQGRPAKRVSLSIAAISQAKKILFLVSGLEKADALARTMEGEINMENWPVHRLVSSNADMVWFVDQTAAAKLY
ncbi:MAG: 6-phosphogluconolactonase [Anaerolineaceae bacterium]|nr:6-phosphogluconolactonase [Anaerolineaceae bacterium]